MERETPRKVRPGMCVRRGTAAVLIWAGLMGLLAGCGAASPENSRQPEETETAALEAVPADGNPEDVTCKGSYTAETPDADTPVAKVGEAVLTNGMLNVFYRLEINGFLPDADGVRPNFSKPLDQQIREDGRTWQQYFLEKALQKWSVLQALEQRSHEYVARHEENFEVDQNLHEEYMRDMPINDTILYTEDASFKLSIQQQAFLDQIPEQLMNLAKDREMTLPELMEREFGAGTDQKDVEAAAWLLNYAYMYFIDQTYDLEPNENALLAQMHRLEDTEETVVDMRHILVVPEGTVAEDGRVTADEDAWYHAQVAAEGLRDRYLNNWRKIEAEFAVLAHDYSEDLGSQIDGGSYSEIRKGQMTEPLDQWLFDPAREPGEVGVVRSDFGYHVVYFCESRNGNEAKARENYRRTVLEQQIKAAQANYPEKVEYEKIQLLPVTQQGTVLLSEDLLYPDIAHERFPEVPVYIQQDYKKAPYGGYKVSSHGCGISALAMLSTYMTDNVHTPGSLAAQYGSYNSSSGTDQMILVRVPPELGYYMIHKTSDWAEVERALKNGQKAISLQVLGYFTRGGHYLVISDLLEDGRIVLRDSNVYNYKRLREHAEDAFEPSRLFPNGQGFWIFDKKVTRIPACVRCGTPENVQPLFKEGDYLCRKCRPAMERRLIFLDLIEN